MKYNKESIELSGIDGFPMDGAGFDRRGWLDFEVQERARVIQS